MVAVQLVCLLLVWWKLPDTRAIAARRAVAEQALCAGEPGGGERTRARRTRAEHAQPLPVLLGLSVSLSQLALAGLWTFGEELGTRAGLSAAAASSFLGFSQLIGLLGTIAPWLLGRWVGRAALGVAGLSLSALGIVAVALVHEPAVYIVGNLAINLGYWVILPLALSVAADLDRHSGRLVAFMLGMSSIGLAIGPSLAGPLLGGADTTLGAWVFGLIGLIAVPLIVPPAVAADRAARGESRRGRRSRYRLPRLSARLAASADRPVSALQLDNDPMGEVRPDQLFEDALMLRMVTVGQEVVAAGEHTNHGVVVGVGSAADVGSAPGFRHRPA